MARSIPHLVPRFQELGVILLASVNKANALSVLGIQSDLLPSKRSIFVYFGYPSMVILGLENSPNTYKYPDLSSVVCL